MHSQRCTLCELSINGSPVTADGTDGVFCCHGCLHVYEMLQGMKDDQAENLRRETISIRKNGQNEHPLPDNCDEVFLRVDGMHCSACESFVEALTLREAGVYKCEASYASEMIRICYDPNQLQADTLPRRLSSMGYTIRDVNADNDNDKSGDTIRLMIGSFFGIMGLVLYSLFLYPVYLNGTGFIPLTHMEQLFFISNIAVMTTFLLFYTGFPILRGSWVSVSVLKPNMDLLVTIAAASAYVYSLGALLTGSVEVYFDVTMAIILVVSLGNYYEKRVKSDKNNLLTELYKRKIHHAQVQRNGQFVRVATSEVKPGDQILIKAGEYIPVDGYIVEGRGIINEAILTGESIPVTKKTGDPVMSGTILMQNALTIEIGTEVKSTIEELLHLVWHTQASRHGTHRLVDRIAGYFVPAIIILGLGTFGVHLFSGSAPADAMLAALAVLIVSCPCALGLATPLAVASGIKEGLEKDILLKSPALFEKNTRIDIFAFDKTGTLSTGKMHLLNKGDNSRALHYASSLEKYSSHPIAEPIAASTACDQTTVTNFESYPTGVKGNIDGHAVYVGKPEWLMDKHFQVARRHLSIIERSRINGNVPIAVAWDNTIQSILVVGDYLRDTAREVFLDIKRITPQTAIITGDNSRSSMLIQNQLQPDFLFTEVKPESKSNIVRELRKMGKVAMAGDGSNDAPALAEADLGIAFGDHSAIAAEAAQIVILNDCLELIPVSFQIIETTKTRIRQNLGWAFLYNVIAIPLAITGAINPLFAAVAMAASSLLVVANSSRVMKLR